MTAFETRFKPWADIINRGECASILNLAKRDQLYRIKQLQKETKTFNKYLYFPQTTHFLYLDIVSERIEDKIDLDKFVNSNINPTKKRQVLFILDADKLLNERANLLAAIDALFHQHSHLSIIYLFQKNITLPKFVKQFSLYSSLYQNIVIFSLFDPVDCQLFLVHLEKMFSTTIPIKLKKLILEQCGGHFWLIKQIIRHLAETNSENLLFNHDGLEFRLNVLFEELEPEEQVVLNKIIKQTESFSSEEKLIIKYFVITGLLKKTNKKYMITIPLFDLFLKKQLAEKTKITLGENKQIIVNNIDVNPYFSQKEKRLIIFLLNKRGVILSRETIAHAYWGMNFNDCYSDWALDQMIRRIRIKLSRFGLNPKTISTKRNAGYIFK